MPDLLALVVVLAFAGLSALHLYWVLGGQAGKAAAVPELNRLPTFVPSAQSTLAVAVGLACCAVLVAASAGLILSTAPPPWVTWLAFLLALALVARAVGDFRLVGFFKRVRGTRFARLDSTVYAPFAWLSVWQSSMLHLGIALKHSLNRTARRGRWAPWRSPVTLVR